MGWNAFHAPKGIKNESGRILNGSFSPSFAVVTYRDRRSVGYHYITKYTKKKALLLYRGDEIGTSSNGMQRLILVHSKLIMCWGVVFLFSFGRMPSGRRTKCRTLLRGFRALLLPFHLNEEDTSGDSRPSLHCLLNNLNCRASCWKKCFAI